MYFCKKCNRDIEDLAEAMMNGCECGSHVFRKRKSENEEQAPSNGELLEINDGVAIVIRDRGTYEVNLKALIERDNGMEPIFVKDKKGVINVLLNPDP